MLNYLFKNRSTNNFVRTSFGNILEWYDFSIYSLLTISIAKAFFPASAHPILLTLFTFGVGFISRPLGSLLFGYIGDTINKKHSVHLSISLMAFPTMLIGVLPEYSRIGIFAPILLFCFRILQGLSAGGQFSGLVAIAVDNNPKRQSFLTSIVYTISIVGTLFASIVASICLNFANSNNEFIQSLAWRVPFLLSGLLFIIYKLIMPKTHSPVIKNKNSFKFSDIVKEQGRDLFNAILLAYSTGTLYFILFSYIYIYIQLHMHIAKTSSLIVLNTILIISIILFPTFGYLADRTAHRFKSIKLFILGFLSGAIIFIFSNHSLIALICSLVIMLLFFCAIIGYTTSLFALVFAKKYRMTACSIAFNLGVVFSGFSPFISEELAKYSYWFPLFIILITLLLFYSIAKLEKVAIS